MGKRLNRWTPLDAAGDFPKGFPEWRTGLDGPTMARMNGLDAIATIFALAFAFTAIYGIWPESRAYGIVSLGLALLVGVGVWLP